MKDVELRVYVYMLKRKIGLIGMITGLGVIISGILTYYVLPPEYETFTTFMVGEVDEQGVGGDYSDILLSNNRVHTYGEIARSNRVAKEVIAKLKLDRTPKALAKKVEVTLVEDTEIIKIHVQDTDPRLAKSIADRLVQVSIDYIEKFMGGKNIQIIDVAEVADKPVQPRPILNLALGGIIGMMLSAFMILLSEYLDTTIKGEEDVEKYLGLPTLGVIPDARHEQGERYK